MAGLKGNWSSKLPQIINRIHRLASRPGMRILTKQLGIQALQLVKTGFREGQSPDGQPWKRSLRGGRPLRDKGILANSFTLESHSPLSFIVGTNVPYAPVHQFGATIVATGKGASRLATARRAAKAIFAGAEETLKAKAREGRQSENPYLIFRIKKRWAKKKQVTIPARPMLPQGNDVPPSWERAFTAIIIDFYELRKSLAK